MESLGTHSQNPHYGSSIQVNTGSWAWGGGGLLFGGEFGDSLTESSLWIINPGKYRELGWGGGLLFGGEFGDSLTESSLWIINPGKYRELGWGGGDCCLVESLGTHSQNPHYGSSIQVNTGGWAGGGGTVVWWRVWGLAHRILTMDHQSR